MRIRLVIACCILKVVLLAFVIGCIAAPPDPSRPLPGRLRAGYMSTSNIDLLPQMAQTGMNAALPKFDLKTPLTEDFRAKLSLWADKCSQRNLAFMPVINWWAISHAKYLPKFTPVVTVSGTVLVNTPCPYTQIFWDRWITPRMLDLVQSVGKMPLAALLIDMEMYDVEYTEYTRGCYCDECFSRYMRVKGLKGPLPAPAERAGIVKNYGDQALYESMQREAARVFASACRNTVHKVRPGLRLGALHLDSNIPLQQGIALGFGTPELPVFCLTEKTYANGFTPYIASVQRYFREMGAHVDLLVGIWQSKYPPENIAEQLYHCAHDSYGYWIYTLDSFANLDYHPLPGTPDKFWSAIQNANHELDKLELNQHYNTAFKIRPFETPPSPLPWSEFVKFDLTRTLLRTLDPIPIARLRGTNWVYFYADKGESISFEAVWRQVGKYTEAIRVGLTSPSGYHLSEGTAKAGQSYAFQALAPVSGVYGIVVMAENYRNSVDINKPSHPYAIYIGMPRGAEFVYELPPLFVSVVQNSTSIELEFVTQNNAEAVKGYIIDKDGSMLWSGVVDGSTRALIKNPGYGPLQIRFDKLPGHSFGTLWVKAVQGVLPLAATDPTGLLSK